MTGQVSSKFSIISFRSLAPDGRALPYDVGISDKTRDLRKLLLAFNNANVNGFAETFRLGQAWGFTWHFTLVVSLIFLPYDVYAGWPYLRVRNKTGLLIPQKQTWAHSNFNMVLCNFTAAFG